jgi:malonyl-CoA O-methyltransferase
MHDLGDELVHAGFADPVIEMERITVRYTRPLDVFADLKAIGAVNSDPNRPRGLMGKTRWKTLVDAWEKCGQNNEWHVTYEVIYGHAWKTQIKLPEGLAPIQFHR